MDLQFFDPVKLSLEENEWLLRHIGEPWVVAGRDIRPVALANQAPETRIPSITQTGAIQAQSSQLLIGCMS